MKKAICIMIVAGIVLYGRPATGDPVASTGASLQASHDGSQAGLDLLLLIPRLGMRAGFGDVSVNKALEPVFPDRFLAAESAAELARGLAPLPQASSNEIVAPSGGAFFSREAPHLPVLVDEGDHFEAGQPLFIIEVMKMFNKVTAPFAGTVTENVMADADGTVVQKGQAILKIEPDERLELEAPELTAARACGARGRPADTAGLHARSRTPRADGAFRSCAHRRANVGQLECDR